MAERISFTVNGAARSVELEGWEKAIDVLRETLGLTGTKRGCDDASCGACTIVVDGVAKKSCVLPAKRLDGTTVLTIEGMARGTTLHPIQEALIEAGAVLLLVITLVILLVASRFVHLSDIWNVTGSRRGAKQSPVPTSIVGAKLLGCA